MRDFVCAYIPQVVRWELTAALGAVLHLMVGVLGRAGEELAEEEAIWKEEVAEDGEVSRSADSISVKHNLVNT